MAVALSSGSPIKPVLSAKDFYDSSEDEHSGQESPFKSHGRKLKIKTPGSSRMQRALKSDKAPNFAHPTVAPISVTAPPPSPKRASPRRLSRQRVNYASMASPDDDIDFDGAETDIDWSIEEVSTSDDDVEYPSKGSRSPAKSLRTRRPLRAFDLPPAGQILGQEQFQRPQRPTLFDDSDAENHLATQHQQSIANISCAREPRPAPRSKDIAGVAEQVSPATPKREKSLQVSPSKTRLASPSKKPVAIPTPPSDRARPSLDGFWDQGQVSQWTELYSPRKQLQFSPKKQHSPDRSSSHREKSSHLISSSALPATVSSAANGKNIMAMKQAKALFEETKHAMALKFLRLLDEEITGGEVSLLCQESGGINLIWSRKLNSTAGRANWRREAIKRRDATTGAMATVGYRHIASIELAEKVIDNDERLFNVMAHEFCHLCNFTISRVINNPHGVSFKEWAAKTTARFGASHGVHVTTKHDYEISYRYLWMCRGSTGDDGCGTEYQRHSRSIDVSRHTCGKCRGRLEQMKPKPRGQAKHDRSGSVTSGATGYNKFVKDHFLKVKEDLPPGSPMKDLMREIGSRYRAAKEAAPGKLDDKSGFSDLDRSDLSEPVHAQGCTDDSAAQKIDDLVGIARRLDFLEL